MGAPFLGGNIIHKGKESLGIAVIILKGHFNLDIFLFSGQKDRFFIDHCPFPVEIFHKRNNAAFVIKLIFRPASFIFQQDLYILVQKGKLPEPGLDDLIFIFGCFRKNLGIREKGDGRPGLTGLADDLHLIGLQPVTVGLLINLAVSFDLRFSPDAEGVDHGHPDAVQSAGHLVCRMIKFTAGMQGAKHQFQRGNLFRGMHFHRNSPAVVLHRDGTILKQDHFNSVAVPGQGLVNTVIDNLIHQVMQTAFPGIAYIHGRSFSYAFKAGQNLYLFRTIVAVLFCQSFSSLSLNYLRSQSNFMNS